MGGYIIASVVAAVSKSIWTEEEAWRAQWLFGLLPAIIILFLRGKVMPGMYIYIYINDKRTI